MYNFIWKDKPNFQNEMFSIGIREQYVLGIGEVNVLRRLFKRQK